MLKILNKHTNVVFTLEDNRAIELYKANKELFSILDGGYQEEEAPRKATVKELVMEEPKEEETKEEEIPERKLEDMTVRELRALAARLGVKYASKMNAESLIKELKAKGQE